jgi:glutamine synthetase
MDTVKSVDKSYDAIMKDLKSKGVKYITAAWVDVLGRNRAKSHPIEYLPQLMAGFARYTPRGINGIGEMDPVEEEVTAFPDIDSLTILPWDTRFAWMAADMWSDKGETFELCARSILKKQIERAAEMGFGCTLGIEPEFYLYRPEDVTEESFGLLTPSGAVAPSPAYDVETIYDTADFFDDVIMMMRDIRLNPFALGAEGGVGQFEVDFYYKDLLEMADRITLFKLGMHQVAKKHGLAVSFMPKPYANLWGNGAHYNIGLYPIGKPEETVLRTHDKKSGEKVWSDTAKHFVAGILSHAHELTAIANPLVNSYKRLTPRLVDGSVSWAPIKIAYGPNNRSCMIRLPENRPAVEVRSADAASNVYLASAFFLAAGLDGIEKKLDPGPEQLELASEDASIPDLPKTLLESIAAFKKADLSYQVFGEEFVRDYSATKIREWEMNHLPVRQSERDDNLPFF